MTKTNTADTTQEKSRNIFTSVYEFVTENSIKIFATTLATFLGLRQFGFLKGKTAATKTTETKPDTTLQDTKKLQDLISKIEDILSKKKPVDTKEDKDDKEDVVPADFGSQAAAALPARSEAFEEMVREHSALLAPETPTHAVTITQHGDIIIITTGDETITTTVEDFLPLVQPDSELATIINSAAPETTIFSDGSVQQVKKDEQEDDRPAADDHVHDEEGEEEHDDAAGEGEKHPTAKAELDESATAGSTLPAGPDLE